MYYSQFQESPTDLDDLQKRIGYQFRNIILLKQALTRQSAVEERKQSRTIGSFQRLEFLGDKVLNLSVSQLLFHYHPDWPEGKLTHETARFVSNQGPLSTIARKWGLGKSLIVGRGEQLSNIRENNKALGDAVEAILGAIFEDSDSDYGLVKKLIAHHWAKIGLVQSVKLLDDTGSTSIENETLSDIIFDGDSPLQRHKIRTFLTRGVTKLDLEYAIMNSYQEIELLKIFCTQAIAKDILNHLLCKSIRESLVPQVKLLLATGADPNSVHECSDEYWSGNEPCIGDPYVLSALQLAVGTYGHEAILMATELLKQGASANWQEGTTHTTKYFKRCMTLNELLTNPPQVEIIKNKITALHVVVRGDNSKKNELIRLLVKQGHANPDLGDADGNTPLHDVASCYSDTNIYDLLVSLGANQDQENNNHQTPKQLRLLSIKSWENSFSKKHTNSSDKTIIGESAASAAWPKGPVASDTTYIELRIKQNNTQRDIINLSPSTEQPKP